MEIIPRKTISLLLPPDHLAKTRDRIVLNPRQRFTSALPPLQRFPGCPIAFDNGDAPPMCARAIFDPMAFIGD
jgi:hypothetical protein